MPVDTYFLGDARIRLNSDRPDEAAKIRAQWQQLFAFQDKPNRLLTGQLKFNLGRPVKPLAGLGRVIYNDRSLKISQTPFGFRLESSSTILDLDPNRGCGDGVLGDDHWQKPLLDQRELFLLGFLILFRHQGRYGLHANGIVKKGAGTLVVGHSGCGKTTLTLGLLSQGWHYLSDDALLLRNCPEGIEALAFRRGFSCTPDTLRYFPAVKAFNADRLSIRPKKNLVDIAPLYPGRFLARHIPRLLLFPKIGHQRRSRLIPLTDSDAAVALIQQSPGILIDRSQAARQLATLERLVSQTRSYCLNLGTDVYENPAEVSNLLSGAAGA